MNIQDLVKVIKKIENPANADIMSLGAIIKSVDSVFTHMRFKGELPKIVVDNYRKDDGNAEEWPSSYCEEEKKILINMMAPKSCYTCASVVTSYGAAWAAAMHVLYANSCKDMERGREAAHKIAKAILKKVF